MTETANQERDRRLVRLRREFAERLEDPAAAIETLLRELERCDLLAVDWDGLHVAAERDDKEVELGTAYQQVLTRPRLHRLDPPQQVRVLMHAADFFQGILGDAELARMFLQRVLEVDPDHAEAIRSPRAGLSHARRHALPDLPVRVRRPQSAAPPPRRSETELLSLSPPRPSGWRSPKTSATNCSRWSPPVRTYSTSSALTVR